MHPTPPTRTLLLLSLCTLLSIPATPLHAQSLPPISPTLPAPVPPASTPSTPQTPSRQPPHRAIIDFSAGTLAIAADNSSLNQILREIARLTGIKITGGVVDERVFGSYGPADPSSILEALLHGTGSNMLLLKDEADLPRELVLTPRQGGPTPPNPNASRNASGNDDRDSDDDPDVPPQLRNHGALPSPSPNSIQQSPVVSSPQIISPQIISPTSLEDGLSQPAPSPSPSPAPAADITQPSSSGAKTPQQIYDQLLKLQQQRPRTPGQPTPVQAPPQ